MNKPLIGWAVSAMLGVCAALASAAPAQAAVQYESQGQALLLDGDPANTPQSVAGTFDLQALLAPDRLLADLLLEFNSLYDSVVPRSIDGTLVGSFLNSDRTPFCDRDACFAVGRIEVAEPISVALLGVGLFGIAAARRRAQGMNLSTSDKCGPPMMRQRSGEQA